MFRTFVNVNKRISSIFDRYFLPASYRVDGNQDFVDRFAVPHLKKGCRVYDVGGGKSPFLSVADKHRLSIHVTGVDIDQNELAHAPIEAYDAIIAADICDYQGQ